jgi:hypothetical protein
MFEGIHGNPVMQNHLVEFSLCIIREKGARTRKNRKAG